MEDKGIRIAVLSGKGGTGKTLLSVNMAAAAGSAVYIDCDVEEPDGHLFFKPEILREDAVSVRIPVVDADLCSGCRRCVDFCRFHALAFVKGLPLLFEEICHSCGGCTLVCPDKAITERDRVIGKVQAGLSRDVTVITGILDSGEASGVPIIRQLLAEKIPDGQPVLIDCPPGSACIVMESIRTADYCLLVSEPTVFGVHNLDMALELVRLFGKPHGVVLNKCLAGENPAETYCAERGIPVTGRIPFDGVLGTIHAAGGIAARESDRYKDLFASIFDRIRKEVRP